MSVPIAQLGAPGSLPAPDAVIEVPQRSWYETAPVLSHISAAYEAVAARRKALGLTNPGSAENINKEVAKDVFLKNNMFTGLRAELAKGLSIMPSFQTTHIFSIGGAGFPPYQFGTYYATDDVFAQAGISSDGSMNGRFNFRNGPNMIFKSAAQAAPGQPFMMQLEQDVAGPDFSLNFKALYPSILDNTLTGVFVGSMLQSVTPKLSLGLETMWSKMAAAQPADAAVSYMGRYVSGDWIASAQIQPQGILQASFWRKVAERVEAGVECQITAGAAAMRNASPEMLMMGAIPATEGVTTLGARYEFKTSMYRAQVDSTGKVACTLDRRVLPNVMLQFAGEIDHATTACKVGVGIQVEYGGEEPPFGEDGTPLELKQISPPV
ncbi:hypothetical protein CANCADRAFT_141502 [Tortispora caseinolytica NRRL Y-17796]|uniref:Mitochondrial import receptor subunit TOM40 n=1 Tax=Tortispora caseinolytica NRRL Y-17796 TaxID=767744 RepID=A0A1E4TCX9_9ASCO|nr:hypothetical protein CANCADRAFT_141502 [Tortispora caseinolytica NRRL Y-17796]